MANLNFFRVMQASQFNSRSIPCNASGIGFNGKAGYYVAQAVVLGDSVGAVTASFNSATIPDRFQLRWSGSIVADSGFVGDGLYGSSAYYTNRVSTYSSTTSLTQYDYDYKNRATAPWITGSSVAVSIDTGSFPPMFKNRNSGDVAYGSGCANYVLNDNGVGFKKLTGSLETGNWGPQFGVLPSFPISGSDNIPGADALDGNVSLTFFKNTKYPAEFDVIIWGVENNTGWLLNNITCPTENNANSSSIKLQGNSGGNTTIYHAAPTFDLRPGMKCYYDSAMTQPVSASAAIGVGVGFLTSGSFPTNPPTNTKISLNFAFGNTQSAELDNDCFLTFYTASDSSDPNNTARLGQIVSCSVCPQY